MDSKEKADPIVVGKMPNILGHRGPDDTLVSSFSGDAVGCAELNTSPQSTYAFSAAGTYTAEKMRFARGVGVDFLMDELAGSKVSEEQFKAMPYTPVAKIRLNSRK